MEITEAQYLRIEPSLPRQRGERDSPTGSGLWLPPGGSAPKQSPAALAVRPRYPTHFTPTDSSWLNQVEIWFHSITQKAIRRGTFRSARERVHPIERFVPHYNATAQPFSWTATPDSIIRYDPTTR